MYSVQYINGYELLALPPNKFGMTVEVAEFRADLSDGYRQQAFYGASSGTKSWNLSFNAMRNKSTPDVTNGDLELSAAKYIYDLWLRTKNYGTPFVIQDSLYNQYYLAEFVNNNLSFEQIFTTLFSTGLTLRQVRIPNTTVFDVSKYPAITYWHKTPVTGATDNAELPSDIWPNEIAGGNDLDSHDCTYQTNELNGKAIIRLDQSGAGQWLSTTGSYTFYEIFLLMKVREATFSDHVGIVSNYDGTAGFPALSGQSGTTKFYDQLLSNYEYRKNGVLYAASNQQAPMLEFGVVHIRKTDGWTMPDGIVFGQDRLDTFPDRKANIDIAEIMIATEPLPISIGYEITEYLGSYL